MDSLRVANEQYERKLDRERRLHAIEIAYQDVVSDAQQKRQNIKSSVFDEAAKIDPAVILEMQHLAQHRIDEENRKKNFFKRLFGPSNVPVLPFVVQTNQSNIRPPDKKTNKDKKPKERRKKFRATRKFFKRNKLAVIVLCPIMLICLAIALTFMLADLKNVSPSVKTKMRLIESILVEQKINVQPLNIQGSPQYEAMLWLAKEVDSGKVQYKNLEKESKISMDDNGEITSINEAYGEKRELLERFVLVTLYRSTTSTKNWLHAEKWLEEGLSVCSGWFGVGCTVIPKEGFQIPVVTNLTLSANKMVGQLPDELDHLYALTQLHLDRNGLTGTLPDSIGNLASLSSLKIDENNFLGAVPESVCKLKNGGGLEISSNCGGGNGQIECSCCSACS